MTPIERLDVSVYRVPTDRPEADGTLAWDHTTVVVAEPTAGGCTGLGFSYTAPAAATVIKEQLGDVVVGRDALDVNGAWTAMVQAIRNLGRPGIVATAIAAVDLALWDLQAKLFERPLIDVLGGTADGVPVYGSGGFTSYSIDELREQLVGWVDDDIPMVKMKIGTGWGRRANDDIARVAAAREAIGPATELFVDANGAYTRKQAVRLAEVFHEHGVSWFEEPVSSDDLGGLRVVRDMTAMDVAAGEYGYDLVYFERMCAAGAVDVVQADVTRCAGISEWRRVAAVAQAHGFDISGHCAPAMHLAVAAASPNLRHLEFFHDHVRIERMLFDGVSEPVEGRLYADRGRVGNGLELRRADACAHLVGSTNPLDA